MTTDGLTDLVNHTTMFRDEKRDAEKRIETAKANAVNIQANQRANKKKIAKKKKVSVSSRSGDGMRCASLNTTLFCPWADAYTGAAISSK